MSNFNLAIPIILQHEGHLVNDPDDPGGITNFGISLRYLHSLVSQHPELLNLYDEDHQGAINTSDIRDMSQQEAVAIYKTQWWDKNNYGLINNQALATKVFDLAVNVGNITANKFLQKSVNQVSGSNVLIVDGLIGPQTINLVNKLDPNALLASVRNFAKNYYQSLVIQNPVLNKFLQGWLNRVEAP